MKKLILFSIVIIGICAYVIFLHENTEYIGGKSRNYTFYEEYEAKDKIIDNSFSAFKNDVYNLKDFTKSIRSQAILLGQYRNEINLYTDSINSEKNSEKDLQRFITSLDNLKSKIDSQTNYVESFQEELNKLDMFISKIEQDAVSIDLYKQNIKNIKSKIYNVCSTKNTYEKGISYMQYVSSLKITDLVKKNETIEEENRAKQYAEYLRETEQYLKESNAKTESRLYTSNVSNYNYSYNENKIYELPTSYKTYNNNIIYDNSIYPTNTNTPTETVRGHYKSNGTYVEPYERTLKNNTTIDNFSFYGNYNPYTGKIGTLK